MSKNVIPVLCCSKKKIRDNFFYKGKSIKLVASPKDSNKDEFTYCRPDDKIPDENRTWRGLVLEQKAQDIIPAYQLYSRPIYIDFYHEFGDRFYIFSAGWGIIRANFRLPAYDITYSTDQKVSIDARRKNNDRWKNINHL